MLLCENKALATGVGTSWVNVVEGAVWVGREKRPTLVPVSTKVDPYGQQMDMLPCYPNKCLCSSTEAFDQQHIFSFGVRLFRTPERTWNRICINMAREECVNNATKEFCSRNVGRTWLTGGLCGLEFKRGGRIEWEAGEIFSVFNDNTSGKLVFLLCTDVSQYKCGDEISTGK